MLAGAAGDFQHLAPVGEDLAQHLKDRGLVVFTRLGKWQRFQSHPGVSRVKTSSRALDSALL